MLHQEVLAYQTLRASPSPTAPRRSTPANDLLPLGVNRPPPPLPFPTLYFIPYPSPYPSREQDIKDFSPSETQIFGPSEPVGPCPINHGEDDHDMART